MSSKYFRYNSLILTTFTLSLEKSIIFLYGIPHNLHSIMKLTDHSSNATVSVDRGHSVTLTVQSDSISLSFLLYFLELCDLDYIHLARPSPFCFLFYFFFFSLVVVVDFHLVFPCSDPMVVLFGFIQ